MWLLLREKHFQFGSFITQNGLHLNKHQISGKEFLKRVFHQFTTGVWRRGSDLPFRPAPREYFSFVLYYLYRLFSGQLLYVRCMNV